MPKSQVKLGLELRSPAINPTSQHWVRDPDLVLGPVYSQQVRDCYELSDAI